MAVADGTSCAQARRIWYPQIAARSERLIRLRDGAVIDDIQLIRDRPVQDIIRHISQLG